MTLEKIKDMFEKGHSIRKICHTVDQDFETVKQIITDNKFTLIKEPFHEDKIPQIIDFYREGISAKTLGEKYNIDIRRIIKWTQNAGILRTTEQTKRINKINEHIFDLINIPEKAYWAAYLIFGTSTIQKVGRITLVCKQDHKNHLLKLVNFIGADVKSIKNPINNKSYIYVINSHHLLQKLNEFDFNKLSNILKYHFIRGISDAIAKFTYKKDEWKWQIKCDQPLLDIKQFLISDQININDNLEILHQDLEIFVKKLYKNANIYLENNYQIYQQIINKGQRGDKLFHKNIVINGQEMNEAFFKSQNSQQIEQIISDITDYFYHTGFIFPDNYKKAMSEFKILQSLQFDLNQTTLNNNNASGVYISKYFCPSFYHSYTQDECSVMEAFADKNKLKKAISYKIKNSKDTRNINPSVLITELKNSRQCAQISIFKPSIAKYMALKYSKEGETIGDYACGFGGRLLGAMSCGRKYIGTDPLTTLELQKMVEFFNFKDVKLINLGSEYYKGGENSVDLYWSSPPYYELERYSKSLNQAYAKGEDYFYNKYWRQTLENVKYMLKPGKWFGVNVNLAHYQMVEIAQQYFGNIVEEITLLSKRSHFTGVQLKEEKIYMFKNVK